MNNEKESLMNNIYNVFSTRLSALLTEKGCTQKDLAEYLGVKPQVVSYYATGKNLPLVTGLFKIAKYFNVSSDYLLGLSNVKTTDNEIRQIADKINLSESSIKNLLAFSNYDPNNDIMLLQVNVLNDIISNPIFTELIKAITNYLYFTNAIIDSNDDKEYHIYLIYKKCFELFESINNKKN